MKKPILWTRLTVLTLSGGGLTVAGTLLPWTSTAGTASPLVQRGIDTPLGILIAVLGVAMLATALLRGMAARIMLLVFGWSSAFWMLVGAQHTQQSVEPQTFGPGWYCSWAGIGLTLILTMGVPLWRQLRQGRAA
jgi:hypothetical protein